MARTIIRESVRYFCTQCAGRVYPYDSFEALTEAPEQGKKGAYILLRSYNSGHYLTDGQCLAWCWNCDSYVLSQRRTRSEIMLDYMKRRGARIRAQSRAAKERVRELEDLLEEQRRGRRDRNGGGWPPPAVLHPHRDDRTPAPVHVRMGRTEC